MPPDHMDGQEQASNSPGARLRRLRESKGITLESISELTHVRIQYLRALEAEDIASLLGPAYARSFLKAYCRIIEADDALTDEYRDLIDARSAPNTAAPTQTADSKRPPRLMMPILVVFLILSVAASVFIVRGRRTAAVPEVRTPIIETRHSLPTDTIPERIMHPVLRESVLTLQILASETTWVSVALDGEDKPAMLMAPGEIRLFDAREIFHLTLGNAGGVELTLNEQPIPPAGNRGEVIRDYSIDRSFLDQARP